MSSAVAKEFVSSEETLSIAFFSENFCTGGGLTKAIDGNIYLLKLLIHVKCNREQYGFSWFFLACTKKYHIYIYKIILRFSL